MSVLLAFAPFLAFALLTGPLGPLPALAAGAVTSAALIIHGHLRGAEPRILEIGTCLLFSAVATWVWASDSRPSVLLVRLYVDAGLLAIILLTIAIRRPFTLAYARERVAPEHHGSAAFLRRNNLISGIWAAAFGVMVAAELAMLSFPQLPHPLGTAVIVLALLGAARLTTRLSGPQAGNPPALPREHVA
ncbi:hypothetical protein J8J14_13675 [Roseomonas sp. SSH11]|uniref:Uncharacterized protein n=1 Tax=Pararoseomonas baculiformis TaxID=2820812 RepID=A0ABS4AH25_9PROT|nr:hypothetical protein [Pararoseomonas baculiformis]MBP0445825.1 hypothetical protein [Pararoseomonas baculiformis]